MSKLCSDENQNQDQKLETIYINPTHCTWQVVLPEKFCAKQMVLKNVIRTNWGIQKSKVQNNIMCPLGDSS